MIPLIPLILLGVLLPSVLPTPVAYFHMGPSKTATTHFQSVAVRLGRSLASKGVDIWPNIADSKEKCSTGLGYSKQMSAFAKAAVGEVLCPAVVSRMDQFLKANLERNRDVLLSAEAFYSLTARNSSIFKEYLNFLKGFRVHVILSLRSWTSRTLSIFNQEAKGNSFLTNASTFLELKSTGIGKFSRVVRDVKLMLHESGGHLTIIDFYGAIADRRDISYVIFCEIAGVLCDFDYSSVEGLGENPSVDLSPYLVGQVFRAYAASAHCSYSSNDHSKFVLKRTHSWWPKGVDVPMLTLNLSAYADASIAEGKELRRQYGDLILHSNRQASEQAEKRSYATVDAVALLQSPEWLAAFNSLLNRLEIEHVCGKAPTGP